MRTLAKDTISQVEKQVLVQGWVNTIRKHGKILFLDIRDRSGIVQCVATKDQMTVPIHAEDVIEITGIVKKRPESMVNKEITTGTVELEVQSLSLLNKSKELPFPIDTQGYDISEEVRLKYRYLDLRRQRLQRNIKLRSQMIDAIRQFLFQHDFIEIETPILTKSTPEGSRDFLVPSRLQPGKFYALPQSPQQYKQLLMVAGFERYFQIAKCIRDEDTRADRGFEFTQVDLEMSFVNREDVMALDEALMIHVVESLGYTVKQKPFPVISYQEAMQKYGADKFDLRTEEEKKQGILAFSWVVDFPFFEKVKKEDVPASSSLEDVGLASRSLGEGWTFTHNPFSSPKPEHMEWLLQKEHIGEILTTQYDLVCNGYEVGGGSIRGYKPEILQSVFEIMGYTQEDIVDQFGHMLNAFSYGAPPHGGLAHGIERLLMILTNEPYLREVVAFPQTSSGQTSIMDAPTAVSQKQLDELRLSVVNKKTQSVFDQIQKDLEQKHIACSVTEHDPVTTSEQAAAVRGVDVSTGAKAILLFVENKPWMVVVPGHKKIDVKLFKSLYNVKDVRMATPEEVEAVTTVTIGAVPPFGHLFDIPLYADESIRQNEVIYFNPGRHDRTIGMKESDWEKAAKPRIGVFSK